MAQDVEVIIDKDVYLPCYQHIVEDQTGYDIDIIYGGRDSGKSRFVAQLLTENSLEASYFRCLLIKKTQNTVQGAQWQFLKDVAEQWGVDHLFRYKQGNNVSITCLNRNVFVGRGMDDPGKVRSFTNPSHAWVEEANQLTEADFITLISSLRSDYGDVKLYMTLNPETKEADYHLFWMYKMFFAAHEGQLSFTGQIVMKVMIKGVLTDVILKYRVTHVTYQDNPYCAPQRIAIHESIAKTNPYWYRVFSLGLWGNMENDNPWAYAFNEAKHMAKQEVFADYSRILFCSFDFNRSPAMCLLIQYDDVKQIVRVIHAIKLMKAGTESLCEFILTHYPGFAYIILGDYSGNTASSIYKEEVTNYTMIKSMLRIGDGALQPEVNPKLEDNQVLVNKVLMEITIEICPVKALPLKFDLINVKKYPSGQIVKGDRKDPAQQADALDCFRYFCNKFFKWIIKMGAKNIDKLDTAAAPPLYREVKENELLSSLNAHEWYMQDDPADTVQMLLTKKVLAYIDNGKSLATLPTELLTKSFYTSVLRDALIQQAELWLQQFYNAAAAKAMATVNDFDAKMAEVTLEWFDGSSWVYVDKYPSNAVAWMSLGRDDVDYRTVDYDGIVVTPSP